LLGQYDGTTKSDGPTGMFLQGNNLYVAGTSVGANNNQKDMVMLLFTGFQVGIPASEISSGVSVFPNPCSSSTEIHFNTTSSNRIISLVDVNGKVVLTENANEEVIRLETSALAKGIYYGMISENGKASGHFKIVVQ